MLDLFENNNADELILRPLQEYVVKKTRDALRQHRRLVIQCATGFGKTILATYFFQQAEQRGKRCLFCCDRRTLVDQTSKVFDKYGLNHGIVMADDPRYFPDAPVQIGSVQTLARRKPMEFDFIIIDECHTFFKAHQKLIDNNSTAFVIGLSATPFTKGLGRYFDTHIEPVTVRQMIDDGYLSDFEVYGPVGIDLAGVRTVAGEFHAGDLEDAADKPKLTGDIVLHWRKLASDRKTIVFCSSVAHSRHMKNEFERNRIKAAHIDGYMPDDEKNGAISAFRFGAVQVLCSVEIAIKGFDVPDVSCVVWATATKSAMKWIQGCGRGLRTFDGKTECVILDHGSNCARLGFPDEYQFSELDDGTRADRDKQKEKEKKEQLPKACVSCDFLKPGGVRKCPRCGFVPEHVDAVEVEVGTLEKLDRKKTGMNEKQATLAALNGYAYSKGFRRSSKGLFGWAIHTYTEMFGCQPSSRMRWDAVGPMTEDAQKFIRHKNIKYAKSKGRAA